MREASDYAEVYLMYVQVNDVMSCVYMCTIKENIVANNVSPLESFCCLVENTEFTQLLYIKYYLLR